MGEKRDNDKKRGRSSSSSSSSSSGTSSSGSSSSGSRSSSSSSSSKSPSPSRRRENRVGNRVRSTSRSRRSPVRARPDRGLNERDRPAPRRSPSPRRRRSPSPRRRDRSGSRGRRRSPPRRSPAARSPRRLTPKRRSLSPSKRICIRNLSKNVQKGHIEEIFSVYGLIKNFDLPIDRAHSYLHRGYGYVEYETVEDAEKAIKHMEGGQIDGLVVNVEMTLNRASALGGGRRSPPRRRSPFGRKASPRRMSPGARRRSPPLRGSGANNLPLGPSRFNRSRSRSPAAGRRARSRS